MSPLAPPPADWAALGPLLVVTVACLAVLALDIVPGRVAGLLPAVGLLAMLGAAVLSVGGFGAPPADVHGMVALDDFARFFNLVVTVSTGLVLLLSAGYVPRRRLEAGEYYALVLFAALGMMLMAAATDLLIVFLGLELMSVSLYVLAGFFRAQAASNESAMKYFLLGAYASGFFLYGIALLYGATGSTGLARLSGVLAAPGVAREPMVLAGVALLLVGFGFKISAVPFHQWAPDVYQGAPTAVSALIATGSKAAAFAGLLRVLVAMRVLQPDWVALVWVLAVLSMTVGNVVALVQADVKRLLAYSSIAHGGYLLVGVAAGLQLGSPAVLFYLLVYSVATAGAFGVVLLLERQGVEAVDSAAYAGLSARHPVLAATLTVLLLSLVGMPPTAGFTGKVYLFGAAVQRGFVWLPLIAVLNSVVAAYYYLRLVVYMYMRDPEEPEVQAMITPAASLALAGAVWATLQLGVWPGPVFALAQRAVAPLLGP